MSYVQVYLWKADDVADARVEEAEAVVDDTMAPQFDFQLYAYDYSYRETFSNVSSYPDSPSLVDAFGDFVMEQKYSSSYSSPDPNEIHLLVMTGGTFGEFPAGHMFGSVGDGLGAERFNDERNGAVGIVNTRTLRWGEVYGFDDQGAYENTVMHEVYHALTDINQSYYDSPDSWCRDDDSSSPDHSQGKIYEGGWTGLDRVSPMATWYTPECDGFNPQPCARCDYSGDQYSGGTSQSFTDCAISEAEQHVSKQL